MTVTREPEYRNKHYRYKTWMFQMIPHLRAFRDTKQTPHLSAQMLRSFNDVGDIHWNRHLSSEMRTNVQAMCRIGPGVVRV